jgi:AcrR family transcriptional regulator
VTADQILESAIRVIESRGEAAVRVRDVCEECGITTPVLYSHFGSRDGLVVAAQTERYGRSRYQVLGWLAEQAASCRSAADFRRVVDELITKGLDGERAENRRIRVSVLGSSVGRPALVDAIREADREFVERFAAVLRPVQEVGWLRPGVDLEILVLWYDAHLDGRLHIELAGATFDPAAWDDIARRAVTAAAFEE